MAETQEPKLHVKMVYDGTCDGEHGMYGDVYTDEANNFGIQKYVLCYPRGKDGKGSREFESYYWIRGWKEKITTGAQMYAALRALGFWPPKSEVSNEATTPESRSTNDASEETR